MDQWNYPTTWKVGDTLNADNLNTRLRDQTRVILKRPLTVATSTTDQTIPTSGHGNYVITFDNIIEDDDGMVIEDTPVTNFYAQREGSYQVWANCDYRNPSSANTHMLALSINGSTLKYRTQHRMGGFGAGVDFANSITGVIFMGVGEYLQLQAWNGSGSSTLTVRSQNNCPRIAIMWLGPT